MHKFVSNETVICTQWPPFLVEIFGLTLKLG